MKNKTMKILIFSNCIIIILLTILVYTLMYDYTYAQNPTTNQQIIRLNKFTAEMTTYDKTSETWVKYIDPVEVFKLNAIILGNKNLINAYENIQHGKIPFEKNRVGIEEMALYESLGLGSRQFIKNRLVELNEEIEEVQKILGEISPQ